MSRTITIYEVKDLDLLPLGTEVWALLSGFRLEPFAKWIKVPREGEERLAWRSRPRRKGSGQMFYLTTDDLAGFMPVGRADAELLEITEKKEL